VVAGRISRITAGLIRAVAITYDSNSLVVCVSWRDAVAYANWLSGVSGFKYRLPNEAEWEYAARSGSDGHGILAPVGERAANSFGLYEISGNVSEWTADCYIAFHPATTDPQQPVSNPTVACERHSVRGGDWLTRPDRQRLTFSGCDPEGTRMSYFGFRVARTLSPDEKRPAGIKHP